MPVAAHDTPRLSRLPRRVLASLVVAAATALSAPPVAVAEPSLPSVSELPGLAGDLVNRALGLLGVDYRRGGNSPDTGLDCSGLVRHVFSEAAGLVLPRRAEEISRAGAPVARSELRPGDLVFFNTLRRTFSHVGIYIGDGRFVHAPSSGGVVRVERLAGPYWTSRFNGGRRLIEAGAGGAELSVSAAGLAAPVAPSMARAGLVPGLQQPAGPVWSATPTGSAPAAGSWGFALPSRVQSPEPAFLSHGAY